MVLIKASRALSPDNSNKRRYSDVKKGTICKAEPEDAIKTSHLKTNATNASV
jgi:hypothetical protein